MSTTGTSTARLVPPARRTPRSPLRGSLRRRSGRPRSATTAAPRDERRGRRQRPIDVAVAVAGSGRARRSRRRTRWRRSAPMPVGHEPTLTVTVDARGAVARVGAVGAHREGLAGRQVDRPPNRASPGSARQRWVTKWTITEAAPWYVRVVLEAGDRDRREVERADADRRARRPSGCRVAAGWAMASGTSATGRRLASASVWPSRSRPPSTTARGARQPEEAGTGDGASPPS